MKSYVLSNILHTTFSELSTKMSINITTPVAAFSTKPGFYLRRAAGFVKEVREKLTSKASAKPEFEYELLLMFVRNELLASLALPALAVVVAAALMTWAPAGQLLLWLAVLFIAKGIHLALCRQFEKLPRQGADSAYWRRHLVAAEFFYGLTWAAVAFVDVASSELAAHFFIFASLMVVTAMRMMFASTAMPVIYAGTIPLIAALVLRFSLSSDPFLWAMAAMAAGIYLYLIFLLKGLNFTVLTMLEYRAEKDLLIAELEQAKAVSDDARRRAEAASMAKSKFLAHMSHELRTPLNAILGFSEVMQSEILGPVGNPTYKTYAGDIHDSGQHLLKLINGVLDLSRIEAGRCDLYEEPVMLTAVLEDCHRLLKLKADKKGVQVIEMFPANLPRIWADQRAVRQIGLNLLSNAIKFTPSGGAIILTAGTAPGGGQVLSVKDSGPGIPEDEIPQVLSPFGQGSLAHASGEDGAGLGLPIVKGLADLHDAAFEITSKLRQGTEVIITFPRKRVMQPLAETGDAAAALTQLRPVTGARRQGPAAVEERLPRAV